MTYTNPNPTDIEKEMFSYAGLYLIDEHDDIYTYAPIHLPDGYSWKSSVEVDENDIEFDKAIIFHTFSETITISTNDYDMKTLLLLIDRMKELGFFGDEFEV